MSTKKHNMIKSTVQYSHDLLLAIHNKNVSLILKGFI